MTSGYYATGGSSDFTRTSEAICQGGYYCASGERVVRRGASHVTLLTPLDDFHRDYDHLPGWSLRVWYIFNKDNGSVSDYFEVTPGGWD